MLGLDIPSKVFEKKYSVWNLCHQRYFKIRIWCGNMLLCIDSNDV
jgi:hypothetical protein